MAVWEGFCVGETNFGIDLVELFANMTNGESVEWAHHNVAPGQELALLPASKGYRLSSLFAQFFPEVSSQRIEIDILDAAVKQVQMPSFGHPFGLSGMDPVGRLIAGPPKAISFHKSFQKMNGMVVSPDPISRDPFGVEGEDLGCQALQRNPGKHEKAGIVDHHVEVSHFCGLVPTDELFSALNSPGSRSPSKTSDGSFADESDVFEMTADDLPVAEVMIASDEAVIEGLKGSVSNLSERRGSKLTQLSPQRSLIDFYDGGAPKAFIVVGVGESGRKTDQAFSMKSEQEFATGHLAKRTVWLHPLPPLTQNLGDTGPSPLPVLINSVLDLGEVRRTDRFFSNGQRFHDNRIAKQTARRQRKMKRSEKFFLVEMDPQNGHNPVG
jgi:hypothetical protein